MELVILENIQKIRNEFLDVFFTVLTRLGDHAEIWIFALIIVALLTKKKNYLILGVISLAVELVLISLILKPIFMRSRPFTHFPGMELLIPIPRGSSFPSGHSASSFSVAWLLWRKGAPGRVYLMTLALLMAFSRMYVFVHYPSDVLVGSLIGVIIAELIYQNQEKILTTLNHVLKKIKTTQN